MNQPGELAAAYAAAVDARDWAALADLFVEDAVLVTPDPPRSLDPVVESRGREQIVATIRRVEAFAATEHRVGSTDWEGDDATATGRTTGEAHHHVDGAEPHSWVWYVEYRDEVVRTGAGWRFTTRALTVSRIEKRPRA